MLKDSVAIVTGAARGIGLAIAQRFHRESARVVLADLDGTETETMASELGPRAMAVPVDITDPEQVRRMMKDVFDRYGRIDVLVNNAGIAGRPASVSEYPLEEWRKVFEINLHGTFHCIQAVLPFMLRGGYGRIVNIASIAGKEGNPNMSAYSSSKAAVIGLTKSAGKELARSGILVNCVTPAVIATEILEQLDQETVDYMVERIPMGRTGKPEEVAALVSWLSSSDCSFTTGAVFDVSGGRATY